MAGRLKDTQATYFVLLRQSRAGVCLGTVVPAMKTNTGSSDAAALSERAGVVHALGFRFVARAEPHVPDDLE
jgi:hypothetical protein